MERAPGKLADLTLVSKYYPVANYSYPQKSPTRAHPRASHRSHSQCSSNTAASSSHGRESPGSEGSAPGLIMEDPADSESSCDEDGQYHAHMSRLWDTFWRSKPATKPGDCIALPGKQYPALIPSPHRAHRKEQSLGHGGPSPPAWPLRNSSTERTPPTSDAAALPKPASTIDVVRQPAVPAHMDSKRQQSRPQSSHVSLKPLRPPRPAEALLPWSVPVFAMSDHHAIHSENDDDDDPSSISPTATTTSCRPATFHDTSCPPQSWDEASLSHRPSGCTIYSVVSHSAAHLPAPEIRPSPPRAPRHSRSTATLLPRHLELEQEQPPPPFSASVFEDDSDDEAEAYHHGRRFFSFHHHRRSESDHKRSRSGRSCSAVTALLLPAQDEENRSPSQQKRHGRDVFGRILGRKNR
ncbi:hypothetical protein E4U41_005398 [Claviceps citrina]|nr:hypothetical protein E4U41_005398 [Claviceps citrina]